MNDATTDPAMVSRWWALWPEANIGLNLKTAGLVVVDCDRHDPAVDGVENFKRLLEKLGLADLKTACVMTGGGGQHWYFRLPSAVQFKGALGPGIDIKANGYVILPPSVHISGLSYVWI